MRLGFVILEFFSFNSAAQYDQIKGGNVNNTRLKRQHFYFVQHSELVFID